MAEFDPSDHPLIERVRQWADQDPDPATRSETERLLAAAASGDDDAMRELADAFGGRLAFGTAGLRGALGPGPRRMNRAVVIQTSAGFAEFLNERARRGDTASPPSIVVGYDGRINSDVFAHDVAAVMAGAGISATLFPEPVPTPALAFAVRHLGASAGVMVTASHNPPRDNGYKVYLGDADNGSQIIPPDDAAIAARIDAAAAQRIDSFARSDDFRVAGPELLDAYVASTAEAISAGSPATGRAGASLRIAYTAMHGVGSAPARRVWKLAGLPEVTTVPEQDHPDGTFPTVAFPNPEEPGALDLAFRTALDIAADLIVAHDPDADRLAIALPDDAAPEGYRRLTGNQLGFVLGWRAAERHRALHGDAPGALACTIVSSPALSVVADAYGLAYAETLSGFKWVSRVPNLVFGFEEALGYLTHPGVVRDKDGISASADVIALAAELATEGRTLADLLDDATERFGHFSSGQLTVRLDSADAVAALAEVVRSTPPTSFGGVAIERTSDLLTPGLAAEPANVLRYDLADGSRVMIRPSGTEPKLKVYIDTFSDTGSAGERREAADAALAALETAVQDFLNATVAS
ncbi:phospho-sugar mutase [Leucobacter tardus]|uniref:Phospho-sugar mutase n=1 Tax=Leucobacter tardus TaxID=501483 RepID=A0A939QEU2_9MICO|nr:phospho-sugar mutase [Leucobacter tardus]MBO2990830.1 phospho-sugar mutase [Leucobacter tardus]